MNTSESIGELATALAAAQGEMSNATLNRQNPHFRSKYADLAAVREATIPVLSKHGLALAQCTSFDGDGTFLLVTRLLHSSGQWMESVYPLPMMPDKPQIMGSAISYSKRYSWTGMCGIASEEDDDGNHAQEGAKSVNAAVFVPNGSVRKSSAAAKRDGDWPKMLHDMDDAQSAVSLQRLWDSYRDTEYKTWNADWRREADELFAHRMAQFSRGDDLQETLADSVEAEPQTRAEYVQRCHEVIEAATEAEPLLVWWNREGPARRRFSMTKDEVLDMKNRVIEKRKALTPDAPHGRDVSGNPLELTEAG
jgi:hypothetical protein